MPGMEGAWNRICEEESEMWIRAGTSMVRRALRRMLPITQACSQVKCAKVKDFSSRASSWSELVGEGREFSIVLVEKYV